MISVMKGDITGLDFDIIVNAANSQLLPGGGVCGAIFAKAGQSLVDECAKAGYTPTGQVKLTSAGNLPCRAIIHAVGPIYVDGNQQESEYLASCYWNALSTAYAYMRQEKLEKLSIAFPCISTGIYGYPAEEACKIAVKTVQDLMKTYPDARAMDVTFVCYGQRDYALYKEALKK